MVHGGWDIVYYGNQNAMQRKCTINKGSPSPSPDGAAVKLNCFGFRNFCCCCFLPALLQLHTKELGRTKSSNILFCLLHLIIAGMRVTAARDEPFKNKNWFSIRKRDLRLTFWYFLALKTTFKLNSLANIDIDNANSFPIRKRDVKLQFWYFLVLLICNFELLTPIFISIKRCTTLSMRWTSF